MLKKTLSGDFHASPMRAFVVLAFKVPATRAGRCIKWKPCRRTYRVRLSTQSTSVASAVGTSTVYVGKRDPELNYDCKRVCEGQFMIQQ